MEEREVVMTSDNANVYILFNSTNRLSQHTRINSVMPVQNYDLRASAI